MSALDEICFLEQEIHDLIRSQQEYEGRGSRAKMDVKKLEVNLETATRDRAFHEKNILHVKLVSTDLANLNEFAKTKKNILHVKLVCENAKITLKQAQATIARCEVEVEGVGKRIVKLRAKLAEYGSIVEFPGKKEPANGS